MIVSVNKDIDFSNSYILLAGKYLAVYVLTKQPKQWWIKSKRASLFEAIRAMDDGETEFHATLPSRNGRPTVYIHRRRDGRLQIAMKGVGSCYVLDEGDIGAAMAVLDAMARGIEWEREEVAKAAKGEKS